MNLAIADIRHNLGRFLLTCAGVGLLMGVALSMVGIYQGLVREALALTRSLGAELWVVEAGTRGPFAEASRIPGDVREIVARVPGVAEAGSLTFRTVEAAGPQGRIRLQVVGYEPGRPGGPASLVAGRGLGGARFELVADRRTGLALGATVLFGQDRYRVVGLTSGVVSIPALVGFITLFGIAARNGIMMISHFEHLMRGEGMSLDEAVRQGSMERLAPILMTALCAGLALIPLVLGADEPGNEIQAPMGVVILGGLLTSTALNMLVVPVLFRRFGRPA